MNSPLYMEIFIITFKVVLVHHFSIGQFRCLLAQARNVTVVDVYVASGFCAVKSG